MRLRSSYGVHSLFARMAAIFLIAVLPVYIVGFLIYGAGERQILRETINTRLSQMNYYMMSVESDIQRMVVMQSACVNGTLINVISNRYASLSLYEWGLNINNHQKELQSVASSSQYADTAISYFPRLQKKIGSAYGLAEMTAQDGALVTELSGFGKTNVRMAEGALYAVSTLFRSASAPLYSIAVRLSSAQFERDMARFADSMGGQVALVCTVDGTELAGANAISDAIAAAAEQAVASGARSISAGNFSVDADGERWAVSYVDSPYLNLRLIHSARERDMTRDVSQFRTNLWLFALTALLLIAAFSVSLRQMVHQPLVRLIRAFERIDGGDMGFSIPNRRTDEFRYVYDRFNAMARNLDVLINQSYKQALMLKNAELKQLQAQINPHFLYNSYFLLSSMIKRQDHENASLFARHMGEYFRYITRNAEQMVEMRDEYEHARLYSGIQAMRFERRIEVKFGELPEELCSRRVPRLILQPLMENAFEHGMKHTLDHGLVQAGFSQLPNGLRVLIEDNGEETTDTRIAELSMQLNDEQRETTALSNIHRRVRALFGAGSGVALYRSNLGGLAVELTIIWEEANVQPADR